MKKESELSKQLKGLITAVDKLVQDGKEIIQTTKDTLKSLEKEKEEPPDEKGGSNENR